ncbi:MAG: hypothetical protein IPL25_13705 [Saprospiraceae bacterium]|nr:hypothetical protein [Candidatus Vicinibacter affinis]
MSIKQTANPKFSILVKKLHVGQEMSWKLLSLSGTVYDPSCIKTKFAIPDLTTKDSTAGVLKNGNNSSKIATEYQSQIFAKKRFKVAELTDLKYGRAETELSWKEK